MQFRKRVKLRFRYDVRVPAPYLALSRDIVRAIVRFRVGFGPDRASLRKRRLLGGDAEVNCRYCEATVEDAGHLLFACVGTSFLTNVLWGFDGVEDILVDGSDWGYVGPVLKDLYQYVVGEL